MKEIEVVGIVKNWNEVEAKMRENAAKFKGKYLVRDYCYDFPDGSLWTQQKKTLRLRSENKKVVFTYKGPSAESDGGHRLREELSIAIDIEQLEVLKQILKALGLQIIFRLDRIRYMYELAGAIIYLEKYPQMYDLIEIEGEDSSINRVISLLNLNSEDLTNHMPSYFFGLYEKDIGKKSREVFNEEEVKLFFQNLKE